MPRRGESQQRLIPPTPLSRRPATQSLLSVRMAEWFLEREGIVEGELPIEEPEAGVAPSLT
ncbi:MAG TPA: hypothetical protein VGK78_19715 [Nocardioides sp.]|uniref:hypothetical protein n=1 Tax=Nocardioides sp. TaxID=35761 RepID=UPI002F404AAD